MSRVSRLTPLKGEQLDASDPRSLVWLSASAGTGKTHVLSARVLRLLLSGVDPASILCLTFTKAGAAEMADRIHARLASWVRAPDATLRKELFALGEAHDEAACAQARTLFARVLDARGGGLRIQTIHAFCQTLLAAFPTEAGLVPGFRPLDPREEGALARSVLSELLVDAEAHGNSGLVRDVQRLSRRLGEGGAESFLLACARRPDDMAALGSGIEPKLRHLMDIALGDVEHMIAQACHDDAFDCPSLRRIAAANAAWGTATGTGHADLAEVWLAVTHDKRAAMIGDVMKIALTASGEPRKASAKLIAAEPDYVELCAAFGEACRALTDLRAKAAFADLLAAALRSGQAYAAAYRDAKRAAGAVDFDDLIRTAERLLNTEGVADWVRYKLDQATDHILVDEAQDTNVAQWSIVAALAGEFFAGEGSKANRSRTIFTVGDFKQAIFGFQGTDPRAFQAAREVFSRRARDAGMEIEHLSLDRSFRSTAPVLALVDRVVQDVGSAQLGLADEALPHQTARTGPGIVTIWRPVSAEKPTDLAGDGGADEEGWVDDATRAFASRIARQIRRWIDEKLPVVARKRAIRPEDILILVRKRGTLASLLVARLHEERVPVAGVDRLRLNAPLAVRDLLAAMRFAVQPDHDLTLANLLVSPLIGWSQQALFDAAWGRRGTLWRHLRTHHADDPAVEALADLLRRADLDTPYAFLEAMLSGALDGRRKLLARLGEEARDPIEELANAALQFEADATPSLQRFLDWFDRGDVDITRDPSAPIDAVRVMTVHGAKGLQAPIVILADATGDPDARRATTVPLRFADDAIVPIPRPRKEEAIGVLAEALDQAQAREREEHWRLFYVALTRAEERLIIAGALSPRCKGVPPAQSWYQAADQAIDGLGAIALEDPIWGGAKHYEGAIPMPASVPQKAQPARPPAAPLPDWLRRAAPAESRPPRPLAPSSIGRDLVADPPPGPALRAAARRGELLHALFERLTAVAPAERAEAADRWLGGSAGVTDVAERRALVDEACAIMADPRFAAVFSPDALAEAPIAAVVGGEVIAGTVDRLLVFPDRVLVVDFKTGRRAPADVERVPEHHLRQMAAYAAALAVIFPDRRIEAALLYTSGPTLIALPDEVIAMHKPGFAPAEQS
jgi:ATP-dependent helicase/nuclease subunit A